MVTIYSKTENSVELRGLSTDAKPTNVKNGSVFIEIDTGTIFMFDAQNEEWKEI